MAKKGDFWFVDSIFIKISSTYYNIAEALVSVVVVDARGLNMNAYTKPLAFG